MARFLNIEIETSQLRVAEVETRGHSQKLHSCFTLPVPTGAVDDGQVRDTKGLGTLLKKELAARGIRNKKVFFVSGSSRIASREVRIPLVKKSQIQNLIQENAAEYFPIDISGYVLSYSIIDIETTKEEKSGAELKQYHLMVYAAPTAISAGLNEFAEEADLNMIGIGFTGDSVYSAVRDEFNGGLHILIKIELNMTTISILKDGELALQRNINYGVDSVIDAVRSFPQFGEDLDEQEALDVLCSRTCVNGSLEAGGNSTGAEDELLESARSEVTESFRYLIGNIVRIMDYYISRNTGAVFDSIECIGLGAGIKGLPELLYNELDQPVAVLSELKNCILPKFEAGEGLFLYVAVLAPQRSGLNLMEKVSRRQKEKKDTLSGAILVCAVGVIAGIALTAAGIGNRLYQEHTQEHLNQRIDEESSIEEIYNTYNTAKSQYENFQNMYQYTNTPNEGLKTFLEEMEQKMPSDITVETFSSTGTEVSFSMRVSGKSAAANTLMQLRTFESLKTVTTTGLDEAEDGTVSMSVICTYAEPALLDSEE